MRPSRAERRRLMPAAIALAILFVMGPRLLAWWLVFADGQLDRLMALIRN